jgi:hypothetical protein
VSRDFNGTSDYLNCSAGVLTTFPFSISVWVKPDTLDGSDRELFGSHDNPSVAHAVRLTTNNGDAENAQLWLFDGDYNSGVRTTTGMTTGAWQNVIAVASSTTSYSIYRDNANSATGTAATSINLSAMNRMTVGRASFAAQDYFDGKIAHLAVWNNYALTSQDRADLQTVGPMLLATQPTLYLPLTSNASPEPDDAGANDFTVNGATYSTDNPSLQLDATGVIFYRRRSVIVVPRIIPC